MSTEGVLYYESNPDIKCTCKCTCKKCSMSAKDYFINYGANVEENSDVDCLSKVKLSDVASEKQFAEIGENLADLLLSLLEKKTINNAGNADKIMLATKTFLNEVEHKLYTENVIEVAKKFTEIKGRLIKEERENLYSVKASARELRMDTERVGGKRFVEDSD